MSQWQGMFLRVKHAWTCLLRVLATGDFHATVAKGNEEALEPSQQTGFQQPGFWITMVGFRIPKPWIPDSKAVDSGFHRPKLPGFRIADYLTWGENKQTNMVETIKDIKSFFNLVYGTGRSSAQSSRAKPFSPTLRATMKQNKQQSIRDWSWRVIF